VIGFYYIIHKITMGNLLSALDCLILTPFVTNSQLWGHKQK